VRESWRSFSLLVYKGVERVLSELGRDRKGHLGGKGFSLRVKGGVPFYPVTPTGLHTEKKVTEIWKIQSWELKG